MPTFLSHLPLPFLFPSLFLLFILRPSFPSFLSHLFPHLMPILLSLPSFLPSFYPLPFSLSLSSFFFLFSFIPFLHVSLLIILPSFPLICQPSFPISLPFYLPFFFPPTFPPTFPPSIPPFLSLSCPFPFPLEHHNVTPLILPLFQAWHGQWHSEVLPET